MKRIWVCLCVVFLSQHLLGQAANGSKDIEGEVNFAIRNAGIPVKGTIHSLKGVLKLNQQSPEKSIIHISADPATIKTGIGIRDKHLQKTDYFDVTNYPNIQMELLSIERKGKRAYNAIFNLTIKDITRKIDVPMSIVRDNKKEYLRADFALNRLHYHLGEESLILADTVKVDALLILD